ncbi:MAG TPA: DUF2007 domain-containing protein [Candidatus Didemnitutus sp.]|jgi:hypothetical protein
MAYLRTVLTYHLPSEAEVDKTLLESEGIEVCLLNANTSRNELGAPFYIQLQVADGDFARADSLLREANPQRFGSPEKVAAIERHLRRALIRFAVVGMVVGGLVYLVMPMSGSPRAAKLPVAVAITAGLVAGMVSLPFGKSDDQPAGPVP